MKALRDVKSITVLAVLSALSFVGMYIQIPFWMAPWLKFDLSEIFCVISAIIFGPWIGLLVVAIKNLLHMMFDFNPIGHAMNFIAVGSMTVIIGVSYNIIRKRVDNIVNKYIWLAVCITIGVLIRIIVMVPVNWLAILYTPYKDAFMTDQGFNWVFARAYVYTTTTVFNSVQGLVTLVISIPLYVFWHNVIRSRIE